ncbi:MAG: hypothetical protein ACD_79C01104G0003 [uncultured bacterium]|nr:MAG: hypothetical protein ACD_79C01104G0003 [uncultured bacterium]
MVEPLSYENLVNIKKAQSKSLDSDLVKEEISRDEGSLKQKLSLEMLKDSIDAPKNILKFVGTKIDIVG